jgi:hypothetical protein
VRVYQCQIVKKPVNAFVRTIEPAAGVFPPCHRHTGPRSSTVPKWFFRSLLNRGFLSPKEHGMGSQDTEFHRSAFLINARGALTAMDDLTGRETDRV